MKDNHYIGDIEKIDNGKSGLLNVKLIGSINKCNVIKPRYPFKKNDIEKFENGVPVYTYDRFYLCLKYPTLKIFYRLTPACPILLFIKRFV